MERIDELKGILLGSYPKEEKLKAIEELSEMAAKGSDKAAEAIYEVLKQEKDPDVFTKPFEKTLLEGDRRDRFIYDSERAHSLFIAPILRRGTIKLNEKHKKMIIKFAKSGVSCCDCDDSRIVPGAGKLISLLADEDELFEYVDYWLKRDTTDIDDLLSPFKSNGRLLNRVIKQLREKPDDYSSKFVDKFKWFLYYPHPETSELIGQLWCELPSRFKEAIRLYYQKRLFDEICHLEPHYRHHVSITLPAKHPLLEWLESFEKGVITSSPASYSALQIVSEKIGFHLRDRVTEIKTEEPSPITLRRRKPESRGEDIELIPIDKYLGLYLPDDQLIKLFMNEIKDCAKRLDVDVETLKRVIELHEAAHAIVHLGRDADGRNFNTGSFKMVDGGADPSPLHETLAQLLCYHVVKNESELKECFEKLNQRQPEEYKHWERIKELPLERVRSILIGMRQGRIEASFYVFQSITL